MMHLNTEFVFMLNFSSSVITVPRHWGTPTVTNTWRCGHSRKNLINHFGLFYKAIITFNLLQPKQKHLQSVRGSWCEKAFSWEADSCRFDTHPLVHRTQALCCLALLAVLGIVTIIFHFRLAQVSAECTYPLSTKEKNTIIPDIQG